MRKPDPLQPIPELAATGIELRHLRYFLAVFDELHFSRAAEILHIAQPPLSVAIRRLEQKLGVELFDRTSRVVNPTEAGRTFAAEVRPALARIEGAVVAARRVAGLGVGLRVGCLHAVPVDVLLRFVSTLSSRDASLQPQVTHLPATEQLRRLRGGELDLGVVYETVENDDLHTESFAPGESMSAVVRATHELAATATVSPADVADEVLVTVARAVDPALHDRIVAATSGAGYRFRDVYEVGGSDARDLLPAVAQGFGVAFGPSSFADAATGTSVVGRALDPEPSMPDTVVAWHAHRTTASVEVVLDVLRELASGA
jgi:DNA-binding transcriptional LysR family regulator